MTLPDRTKESYKTQQTTQNTFKKQQSYSYDGKRDEKRNIYNENTCLRALTQAKIIIFLASINQENNNNGVYIKFIFLKILEEILGLDSKTKLDFQD